MWLWWILCGREGLFKILCMHKRKSNRFILFTWFGLQQRIRKMWHPTKCTWMLPCPFTETYRFQIISKESTQCQSWIFLWQAFSRDNFTSFETWSQKWNIYFKWQWNKGWCSNKILPKLGGGNPAIKEELSWYCKPTNQSSWLTK